MIETNCIWCNTDILVPASLLQRGEWSVLICYKCGEGEREEAEGFCPMCSSGEIYYNDPSRSLYLLHCDDCNHEWDGEGSK